MTPPKLARDRPVAQVLQPVSVNLFVWNLRHETRLAVFPQFGQSDIAQLVHATKPLSRNQRLDHSLAAFAFGDREFIIDGLLKQAEFFELLDNQFTRLVSIETREVGSGFLSH